MSEKNPKVVFWTIMEVATIFVIVIFITAYFVDKYQHRLFPVKPAPRVVVEINTNKSHRTEKVQANTNKEVNRLSTNGTRVAFLADKNLMREQLIRQRARLEKEQQ